MMLSLRKFIIIIFMKVISRGKTILGRRVLYFFCGKQQLQRFSFVSKQYSDLCNQLEPEDNKSRRYVFGGEGYDWKHNTEKIKNSFNRKVPLNFLRNPTIAYTMVYGGDYKATREDVRLILKVWTSAKASKILFEDYIGLPGIDNLQYFTSANRIHHAYHLVSYEALIKKSFDSCNSIVEVGGGDMVIWLDL